MTGQIFNREQAAAGTLRILDEHGAEQYANLNDGGMVLLGDGWTINLTPEQVSEFRGELREGWKLIQRATFPKTQKKDN